MKIDIGEIKAGFRTAGGLLAGNSLVVPVLTRSNEPVIWQLFVLGFVLILATSLKRSKP